MRLPPAITLQNVCLSYKQQPLFHNLNLELPAGKCVAILGPSGCGKTSLLRLIAGLQPNTKPLAKDIAYMAQQDMLMPWLNVLDNVLIGNRLRGKVNKQLKQKASALLAKIGLADVAKQRPDTLSGGMRQRVALARTLMEDKPVILMDEPFSSLDAITRLRLQEFAAELLKDRTVLLVTHDPLEALRLADIVYILSGFPAQLSQPIIPQGNIPRDPTNLDLLALQAELLQQLEQLS